MCRYTTQTTPAEAVVGKAATLTPGMVHYIKTYSRHDKRAETPSALPACISDMPIFLQSGSL